MKRFFYVLLNLGILCQISIAQNIDIIKLDKYFETLESNNKFMGGVAVSQNGEIIYSKSVGFSDFKNNIKADENTKYGIGSISKTFTTVLVLKGVEENIINLQQTIDKYFPTIINSNKITIENLLYHRSGIHNFTNNEDYLTWNTQPKTEKEMVAIIAEGGSDFEPDSLAQYSNSNYVLLSYILEKNFQKSYKELLKEYITEAIGLKNTIFDVSSKKWNSYNYIETWELETKTDISIPMGAGGIFSTPIDLVKFSDALFAGNLIKKESLERMKILKDNYGMGLFQFPFYDKVCYGHDGGIDSFSSDFVYFSDGNISYALTSNGTRYNNNDISIAVLSAIFDKPYDIPVFTSYDLSSEDLDKYLGVYTSTQLPFKITVTKENNTLFTQAADQPSIPMEATEKDKFQFDPAGIVLVFNPTEKTMTLKQGEEFIFTKE